MRDCWHMDTHKLDMRRMETRLPSDHLSADFDFRFERMHICFHLGRAACSNSIPTHSLRYHAHQS